MCFNFSNKNNEKLTCLTFSNRKNKDTAKVNSDRD